MALQNIPFGAPGVAGFSSDDGFSQPELLMGDVPPNGGPVDVPVKASSTFPIFAVVGRDVDGNLAMAKKDGSVAAEGVLMVPVATGVGVTTSARIHTSGHYNMNALAWDASFVTPEDKRAAFPMGRNILIGKNPYDRTSMFA